jgi:hypothetical protein
MPKHRKPPSQTWRTFRENHASDFAALDFFTIPTVTFRVLFVLVVLRHGRRRVAHINVTEHPTAQCRLNPCACYRTTVAGWTSVEAPGSCNEVAAAAESRPGRSEEHERDFVHRATLPEELPKRQADQADCLLATHRRCRLREPWPCD